MEEKEQKERLEYLLNLISGFKDIKVRFDAPPNAQLPKSDIQKREVYISKTKDYNKKKSESFQELGHIWLSGSLNDYKEQWNTKKYGNFESFKWIVNILEDIRTENLLSIRYPQIKNRLINLHIVSLNDFLEKNPNFMVIDPRAALYLLAENRFEIPIEIDKSLEDISKSIKSILDKNDFKNGNWKNMLSTALEITEEIYKWEIKKFGKLMKMLEDLQIKIDFHNEQYQNIVREDQNKRVEKNTKTSELLNNTNFVESLKRRQENLKSLSARSSETDSSLTEEIKKELEKLQEKQQSKEKDIEKTGKDIEEINKCIDKLATEQNDVYNKQYKPAVGEQTKIADEVSKLKAGLNENYGKLPVTFLHNFEKISEKNGRDGSKLTARHMVAIRKKEERGRKQKPIKDRQKGKIIRAEIETTEEEQDMDDEMFEHLLLEDLPISEIKEPTQVTDDKMQILKVTSAAEFEGEGHYTIPDLKLALSDGYIISSELKRRLKLEAITLKHRLYGSVDMKAVKRQIAKFGRIVDPKVMKIKKDLIEKHSVLVLTDFSGSMAGKKVQFAKQALVTLGKTLENLNVSYSLRGFSAMGYKDKICDIILKDFDDPHMDYTIINKVFCPRGGYENRDGSSIRHAIKLLEKQRGKKMLIVISDGLPSHVSGSDNYGGEIGKKDTRSAILEAENKGIHIMGISIDMHANDFVLKNYPNSFVFNDLSKLPQQITRSYIEAMRKV